MTSPSTPSDPVPPTDGAGPTRPGLTNTAPSDVSFLAFVRAPFLALRKRAEARRAKVAHRSAAGRPTPRMSRGDPVDRTSTARRHLALPAPTGLFQPGEIEYARLRSQPPFDSDVLILTDRRLMRVRTDDAGTIAQLSQAAPWQIERARAEDFREHTNVTVELHVGASMRLEGTASAEARRFVTTLNEVAARA